MIGVYTNIGSNIPICHTLNRLYSPGFSTFYLDYWSDDLECHRFQSYSWTAFLFCKLNYQSIENDIEVYIRIEEEIARIKSNQASTN